MGHGIVLESLLWSNYYNNAYSVLRHCILNPDYSIYQLYELKQSTLSLCLHFLIYIIEKRQ